MGIAPRELHRDGSMLQLQVGSSTGMTPLVVKDNIEFIDEDTAERTGIAIKTPWDVEGADILLIHNAGEIMAWPENPGAFATIFNRRRPQLDDVVASSRPTTRSTTASGTTTSSSRGSRSSTPQAARKLGVKKIVIGECGHAHKALTVIADKVLTGDLNIPRESSLVLLRDIVRSGQDRSSTRAATTSR